MMELIERLRAPGSVKSWAEADAQRAEAAAAIERLRDEAARPKPERAPVAAQCRFVGEAWGWCGVAHARAVMADPGEWPRYEVRLLYEAETPNSRLEPAGTAQPGQVGSK